jgi:nucleoside-diphosphate-sugar epimerase
MKVLVTGGTGFTGSHLAKKLYSSGHKVRLLVRDHSKVMITDDFYPEVIQGDIRDPESVDRAVKGVELVFHIAAVYRTAGIPNQVYWDIHVDGTENILKSSVKHGVKRFIHCSTVGVHGDIKTGKANETHPFSPGDIYQITKLKGELTAEQFSKETDLPISIIRPCAIYGPGDLRLLKLFNLAYRRIVPIIGSGDIFYHMVYIDDLVDAFLLASENDDAVGEAFIIGGSQILTLNKLIDDIAAQLNLSPIKIHLPARPFQLLGMLCERICIPLKMEPPIYRRRVDFFTKSRAFDISKAKKILNFSPKVLIKEGLALTASWYLKHGLL